MLCGSSRKSIRWGIRRPKLLKKRGRCITKRENEQRKKRAKKARLSDFMTSKVKINCET